MTAGIMPCDTGRWQFDQRGQKWENAKEDEANKERNRRNGIWWSGGNRVGKQVADPT